jgi:hypothetical protein
MASRVTWGVTLRSTTSVGAAQAMRTINAPSMPAAGHLQERGDGLAAIEFLSDGRIRIKAVQIRFHIIAYKEGCDPITSERDTLRSTRREGSTAERYHSIAGTHDIARQIAALKDRLTTLDRARSEVNGRLSALEQQAEEVARQPPQITARVTMASPTAEKIALFRTFRRGPRRRVV